MDKYDFHEMTIIMKSISSRANKLNLSSLKEELNEFFSGAKCIDVIYTDNTDKLFFGMSVMPVIPNDYLLKIYNGKIKTFDRYYLELDSKLFSRKLNLSPRELTAILLHEVGHVVQNAQAGEQLSEVLNVVVAKEGIVIDNRELSRTDNFMKLGIQRAIRKLTSIFHKNEKEYIADHFVVDCGFGSELENAYDKIITSRDSLSDDTASKYKISTLLWALSIYTKLGHRRKVVMDELENQESLEGSELMKDVYKKAIYNIKNLQVNFILNEGILDTIKYSDIKQYDKELYEYKIRIANVENETEAIELIRDVNYKLQLMEEYLETGNRNDIKRVQQLINKYQVIRDEIISTPKFQDKMYGLYVKHPEIKSRYNR